MCSYSKNSLFPTLVDRQNKNNVVIYFLNLKGFWEAGKTFSGKVLSRFPKSIYQPLSGTEPKKMPLDTLIRFCRVYNIKYSDSII
jgi:hypothetical protein